MAEIFNRRIARYEDSHQVHSVTVVNWTLKTTMKKLDHNLYVIVDGPPATQAERCFEQAAQAGLIAAAAAAFVGAGLAAAEVGFAAAKASMLSCMGDGVDIHLKDDSHWVYWEL